MAQPIPAAAAISLCMIARNAASSLARCLGSVRNLVDEVVLADTGSTDETRQVAIQHGARVLDFQWRDDFASARNFVLSHARCPWSLRLDCDEWLEPIDAMHFARLRDRLGTDPMGFFVRLRSPLCDGQILLVDEVRLFPRHPEIVWRYRVHEQILPALRAADVPLKRTRIVIQHDGYSNSEVLKAKATRNLAALELDLADRPDDPFLNYYRGMMLLQMNRPADAIESLGRVVEAASDSFAFARNGAVRLIEAHLRLGQSDEAYSLARRMIEKHPNDRQFLLVWAELSCQCGDRESAVRALEQFMSIPHGFDIVGSVPERLMERARLLQARIGHSK